jgi:hypothetical protein
MKHHLLSGSKVRKPTSSYRTFDANVADPGRVSELSRKNRGFGAMNKEMLREGGMGGGVKKLYTDRGSWLQSPAERGITEYVKNLYSVKNPASAWTGRRGDSSAAAPLPSSSGAALLPVLR